MTSFLAAVGVVCLLLCSAIVMLLPVALAIWVSPAWLWLYLFYMLFAVGVGYFIVRYTRKHNRIGGEG